MSGRVDYSQTKFKGVAGLTTDTSGGVVIPNGEKIAPFHFRANGVDPTAYVMLAWDWGGAAEAVIASTKGDIDIELDTSNPDNIFIGDGSKKLSIIIVNDGITTTPFIGGAWEATKVI